MGLQPYRVGRRVEMFELLCEPDEGWARAARREARLPKGGPPGAAPAGPGGELRADLGRQGRARRAPRAAPGGDPGRGGAGRWADHAGGPARLGRGRGQRQAPALATGSGALTRSGACEAVQRPVSRRAALLQRSDPPAPPDGPPAAHGAAPERGNAPVARGMASQGLKQTRLAPVHPRPRPRLQRASQRGSEPLRAGGPSCARILGLGLNPDNPDQSSSG